jgi:AraC family transcriptional regulator of adaptative response/methylated-DNA-[protein]-cysteine methyltransferase
MGELEFYLYKVSSEVGEWLAVFEADEMVFLGSYNIGKKEIEADLSGFLHKHYNFHIGKFQVAKWTKGNFWKKEAQDQASRHGIPNESMARVD